MLMQGFEANVLQLLVLNIEDLCTFALDVDDNSTKIAVICTFCLILDDKFAKIALLCTWRKSHRVAKYW